MSVLAESLSRIANVLEQHLELHVKQLDTENRERNRKRSDEQIDLLARRCHEPRKLNGSTFARSIPGFAEQFQTKAPADYWRDIGDNAVSIKCVCQHALQADYGTPKECECGRWFLYDGKDVRVARFHENDQA